MAKQEIICGDSLEVMKTFKDKQFDLVITDPPYGIGADKGVGGFGNSRTDKHYTDNWDSLTPSKEYFDEILRIGKNAIIFGGQFFCDKLPVNGHWIVWDKKGNHAFDNPFGDAELAWTSFDRKSVSKYVCIQQGFVADERERYHPTQKPKKLFARLINEYTADGGNILDPFMGSGTTLVAAKYLNRSATGIEISEQYCEIARKRLSQGSLFASDTKVQESPQTQSLAL